MSNKKNDTSRRSSVQAAGSRRGSLQAAILSTAGGISAGIASALTPGMPSSVAANNGNGGKETRQRHQLVIIGHGSYLFGNDPMLQRSAARKGAKVSFTNGGSDRIGVLPMEEGSKTVPHLRRFNSLVSAVEEEERIFGSIGKILYTMQKPSDGNYSIPSLAIVHELNGAFENDKRKQQQ